MPPGAAPPAWAPRAGAGRAARLLLAVGGLVGALALATPAAATPEEVQVYMDEMNDPGKFGLDVHTSYVFSGDTSLDYPGEQSPIRRLRITPEWAVGLTPHLELGVYLPLATVDRHGGAGAYGAKLRLKFIAPKAEGQNWFWGVNYEIGRVARKLDPNPYNSELKGILGWRSGPWTLAANANLDFKVSGPVKSPATLELASKVSYAVTKTLAVGVESYNELGEVRRLGQFGSNEHATYLTFDKSFGRWDVNLGIGSGYGVNRDRFTIKAIIGVPID